MNRPKPLAYATARSLLETAPIPPVSKSGDWTISMFHVTKQEAGIFNLGLLFNGHGHRAIVPGTYHKLSRNGIVSMSNTPAEIDDHADFVMSAYGDVLVAGLGLGIVTGAMLKSPNVSSVTVVEISEDVIRLTHPTLQELELTEGTLLRVVHQDIHEHQTFGNHYHSAWFDIWDHISSANLPEMTKLSRQFRRPTVDIKGFWAREECYDAKRRRW